MFLHHARNEIGCRIREYPKFEVLHVVCGIVSGYCDSKQISATKTQQLQRHPKIKRTIRATEVKVTSLFGVHAEMFKIYPRKVAVASVVRSVTLLAIGFPTSTMSLAKLLNRDKAVNLAI
eukprot:3015337-Pyramimonas_sp.AAC.3